MVDQGANEYSSARLYLAFSEDGFVWRIADSPCLSVAAGSWDQNRVYRATGLPRTGGGYDIWYSALDGASGWHIGRTIISGV
jgi:hypothetical protein